MFKYKQNFLYQEKKPLGLGSKLLNFLWLLLSALPQVILVLLIIFVLGAGLLMLTLKPHYDNLKATYSSAKQAEGNLRMALTAVNIKDFSQAEKSLTTATTNLNSARESWSELNGAFWLKSSYVKNQYEIADELMSMGVDLAQSLSRLVVAGEDIVNLTQTKDMNFANLDETKKKAMLQAILSSEATLLSVRQNLADLENKVVAISGRQPSSLFNPVIEPLQKNLPVIERDFDGALTLIKFIPALAGYPEQKQYLFLMQNNREMRPSGGFIGTYGVLTLENGGIKNFFTDNSYNLDQPVEKEWTLASPEPMKKYMNQPLWFFRDSNWYADFPTSAEKALWFYTAEGGTEKLDGVIALTPTVLENILEMLGEFEVAGLKFNSENFWEQLQYQVEYGYYKQGIAMSDRKDIISELGAQMIDRLMSLPAEQWPELGSRIIRLGKEKQISLYFLDQATQNLTLSNGWAGEVKDFAGDYIHLVDANLAALKTDSVMTRTLVYNLNEAEAGDLTAEVKVNYQNNGTFSWKTTRYRSYTRLYVPIGSELIFVSAGGKKYLTEDIDVTEEFGKTSFGVFFEVEPQTAKEVIWQYRLPIILSEQIKNKDYSLLVQKQAGLPELNLQLNLNFLTAIQGREAVDYQVNSNKLKHVEVLRSDQEYHVWFK